MSCYGGACQRECPMYEAHHCMVVICDSCHEAVLSRRVAEGKCPFCGGDVSSSATHQLHLTSNGEQGRPKDAAR